MNVALTSAELEAYLDEALAPADMARVEQALRSQPDLAHQLSAIHSRRDCGVHSLGEIWRQHRLSCLSREELGAFLLGTLDPPAESHFRFHLEVVGCRYCQANLADLQGQQAEAPATQERRRSRYFQSSAGYLRK
jgi:anti-sigma factor RsiW